MNNTKDLLWIYKPSILWEDLNPQSLFSSFIPLKSMSSVEKVNCLTRILVFLGLIVMIIRPSTRFFVIFITTFVLLWLMLYVIKKNVYEGFYTTSNESIPSSYPISTHNQSKHYMKTDHKHIQQDYTQPTMNNPLMNVLQNDYKDAEDRKPAEPSYNTRVRDEINKCVEDKFHIYNDDPTQYHLGDSLKFEQSMRQFYTMPNTQIPNDQDKFLKFCYGSMGSCRGGDSWACERHNYRHILR